MPDTKPASVRVRDLGKRYGAVDALRGASFQVAEGEVFGLLGPNGAGKTTALECILGLRSPDSGSIEIGGIDALARPEAAKARVGAQLQGAALQDKLTPRAVLGLFASFHREHAAVGDLLSRFGLVEKADAAFDSLSAGQKQRLFIALAFVNNPQLVVLDEPTAGLDPASRRDLHGIIRGIRKSGRTVLLSTHDLREAQDICDTVAILDGGRIVATGSPSRLIDGSSAQPTLAVRTLRPVEASALSVLGGVTACRQDGGRWLMSTSDLSLTVSSLASLLKGGGNGIADIQVLRPTLEDVFLSVTGKAWSQASEEEA